MKLLFDENLSPDLADALADLYPESTHVRRIGLERADDAKRWQYARANGFALVSKDDDFRAMALLYGHPPKVIRVTTGNCSTALIERLLRDHHAHLSAFNKSEEASIADLSG